MDVFRIWHFVVRVTAPGAKMSAHICFQVAVLAVIMSAYAACVFAIAKWRTFLYRMPGA